MPCGHGLRQAIRIATLWAQEAEEFWRQEALRARPPMQPSVPQTSAASPATGVQGQKCEWATRPKMTIRPKRENRLAGRDERRLESRGEVLRQDVRWLLLSPSSRGTNAQDTDACQAACPGAWMEVYQRASADRFEDADIAQGKAVCTFPTALSYRTELPDSCSCKVERKRGFAAFFAANATLVQGSIVVTEKGIPRVCRAEVPLS